MDLIQKKGYIPYMRNVVYRHADKYVIIRLLKEIGVYRLESECRLKHLPKPKRVRLFYLEAKEDSIFLKYKYHDGTKAVMKIDSYELPETGWTRVELR